MKKFWLILKYFGYVTGALGSITVAVLFFDGMKEDIIETKEAAQAARSISDSTLGLMELYDDRITANDEQITANQEAIKYNIGQTQVLIDSYLDYLKHDSLLMKDDFIRYMDPFLQYVKKNSSSRIQSGQIPYAVHGGESITAITKEKSNLSQ
jgi:hypothetical protein